MIVFRKNFLLFSFLNASLFIVFIIAQFCVDPFCFWHKHWFKGQHYEAPEVLLNIGLLKNFLRNNDEYDTILISTSHMKTTYADEIASSVKSNKKALKFCLPGGMPIEFETMMRKALKLGNVKNVVFGFELDSFSKPAYTPHQYREFPYQLYKNNYLIFFNYLNIVHTLKFCFHMPPDATIGEYPFNDLNSLWFHYWFEFYQKKHRKFLSEIVEKKKYFKLKIDDRTYSDYKDFSAINRHLLPILKENPHVNFYIIIIPYSVLYFGQGNRYDYKIYSNIQKYLIEKIENLKNVKVFGFFDCSFVVNIANYYDYTHFHPNINKYILYCISNNLHILNRKNFDNYEKNAIENLKTFHFKDYYNIKEVDSFESIIKSNNK